MEKPKKNLLTSSTLYLVQGGKEKKDMIPLEIP